MTCCEWISLFKLAASGGADRAVMLWNPFSHGQPVARLLGHTAPLVALAADEHAHQLISLAADKVIKVCVGGGV